MKIRQMSKILAMVLAVIMLVGVIPVNTFAALYDGSNSFNKGSDYYNVISEKSWDIAPGVQELEQVLNNDAGTRRQVLHTAVVDVNNPFVKVIPGTKGMWPQPGNYAVQSTSVQALEAEKLGYGNVVVATNCSLSWYTEAYYSEHPELIGEPLGYSILNGEYYANSRITNGTLATGGVQTVVVINYDFHPFTGEPRPADMPKTWIRSVTDPLTGWEEQAIPVLFGFLVKPDANGNPVNQYKEDHGSGIASRTFVGVKADGTLVIAVSDGEQAPYSTGFTNYEMAEYMIEMGCIIAANCDGGGSTTFCSQRPGEDLKVNCSLSDGGERPTSNTILVVSTAPADGEFARATLSTDYDFYTPGGQVIFNALGTDAVGTKVEIPTDVEWAIKEAGMGSIVNGVFTSNGTEGKVTAQMIHEGKIVGEKSVTIAIPDTLSFEQPVITVPFGKTVKIPVKATANISGVDFEIGLGANDVTFTTTNAALGTFNGLNFVAAEENFAPVDLTSTVTATLNMGSNPTATVRLNLGKGSEVLWDFEGGEDDIDIWNVVNNRKNAEHWDYYMNLSLADRTNGQVHDGNYSMRLEVNGLSSKLSHSEQYAWIRLGVDGEAIVLENARSVGFWLYVPEDNIQCWVQGHYKTDSNGDGVFDTDNVVSMMQSENVYYNIDESGWHYLSMDISAFQKVALQADKQYDIDPSDGMTGEKGEFFLAIVFHKAINNMLWQENGSIIGNYTYYLDNFTVDYSEAVDDRENPVFEKIYLDGTTALIKRDVVTTNSNILNLSAAVADQSVRLDADKNEVPLYNASGLDAATAKVYIDGVEVESTFADGVLSATATVADGYHRVKFEICDKMGNKSVVIRVVKVESGNESSTINVVPDDPTLDRLPFGSIYWMNLEATNIETIQSVQTVIDLNLVNHWQLDHMYLADGFSAEYTIAEETNTATITITRTGDNTQSGAAVLAKLPVRMLYFDTDIKTPGYTAETYWTSYKFWAQDLKMDVDKGLITHVDGKTSTFSNEEFHVDSEMYTGMSNMDKVYFAEHGTTHVHTPAAIADKAPTCTQPGYTGRTFCEGCNSVVEWGTTVRAIGHTYTVDVTNRAISCACGHKMTSTGLVNVDGKNYYLTAGRLSRAWIGIDDDWYYFDMTTFAGFDGKKVADKGVAFVFENGRVTDGVWETTSAGTRYWYGPGYYKDTSADAKSSRPYEIDGKTYLFNRQGYMQTGIVHYLYAYNGTSLDIRYYDCGTDGVATLLTGPYDGYFYVDGIKAKAYQLIEFEGDYYYVGDGHKLVVDRKVYLSASLLQGTPFVAGNFYFDADGKMVLQNGPGEDGYFYLNGVKQNAYQLINFEGDYYFIGDYNKYVVNKTVYLNASRLEGTLFKPGNFTFGADGKMEVNHGPEADGYFYLYGVKQSAYQLIAFEGDYYLVSDYNKYAVNRTVYLSASLLEGTPFKPGNFNFGADGKMEVKHGPHADGYFYLNGVKQSAYQLIAFEGDYYLVSDYHKYAVNRTVYLSASLLEGTPFKPGNFDFGADGKMVVKNGPDADGYFYINGVKQSAYQLFEFKGNYYYVGDYHKVVTNRKVYINEKQLAGTPFKPGNFVFDEDGKMIVKNGPHEDGYFYVNGVKQSAYQLFEFGGAYYFVSDYHKYVANKTVFIASKYLAGTSLKAGYYTFDSEGKMILD